MFKQRQVRHSSKFSSRMRSSGRHRREYAASMYTTALIQFALGIVLVLAAWHSYRAVATHSPDIALYLKLAFPVVFTVAAIITLRLAVAKVRDARALWLRAAATDESDTRP